MKDQNRPAIEAVALTPDDLSLTPPRFTQDGQLANLISAWTWGWMQEDPHSPPIHYIREFISGRTTKIYGFIRLGDNPSTPQTGLSHCDEMYPADLPAEYRQVQGDPEGLTGDPVTYEQRGDNPQLLYRFSSKHVRVIEANFLDVTYDYLPYAMVLNANGLLGLPYIHQHAIIKGTYEGRPVSYLGGWDRMYTGGVGDALSGKLFAGMSFVGVRPGGVREWGFVGLVGSDKSVGFYCKDDEAPVVSSDVKLEATWVPHPYAHDNSMLCTKAIYRFAGKVLHYEARWGFRGQTAQPLELPGLSQTSGLWYEGDTPYSFEKSYVFAECHNAFPEHIRALPGN